MAFTPAFTSSHVSTPSNNPSNNKKSMFTKHFQRSITSPKMLLSLDSVVPTGSCGMNMNWNIEMRPTDIVRAEEMNMAGRKMRTACNCYFS